MLIATNNFGYENMFNAFQCIAFVSNLTKMALNEPSPCRFSLQEVDNSQQASKKPAPHLILLPR